MFQLFKERNFSDYINDTFQFFKVLGKHFFKLYFVVNGGLLLIATVLIYFFTKVYFDFIISNLNGTGVQDNFIGNYIQANFGMLVTFMIVAFVLFLIISLMQFAFPVLYLDLYDSRKGIDFAAKDILYALKKRIGKIIKFVLGSIFIIFPIVVIVMVLNFLMFFIIIGIPLIFITMPALMSWVNLSFYYYMNSDESFFSALGDGFETIKGQFWPIVLSTLVLFIIYYIVTSVFTLIPYLFGIASIFTTTKQGAVNEQFSMVPIMVAIVMIVSTIVSYILNNLLLINQGMIYYSHIENSESSISNDSIDLIGTDSE